MSNKNIADQEVTNNEAHTSNTTSTFFEKYRKPLMAVGIALVVGVGGYFAYDATIAQPREREAANALWKAQYYLSIDSIDWALNGHEDALGFHGVIDNYEGTDAAELAHYGAAICFRTKGDFGNALAHFQEVNVEDQAVAVYVLGNIGDMNVELGQLDEAVKYFEKAAATSKTNSTRDALAGEYLLKAARVYIEQGNKEKAKETLEKAMEGIDNRSATYIEADKMLNFLKAQG
jgi:tetratricopeptide (TPR) repeat protein